MGTPYISRAIGGAVILALLTVGGLAIYSLVTNRSLSTVLGLSKPAAAAAPTTEKPVETFGCGGCGTTLILGIALGAVASPYIMQALARLRG